MLLLAPISLAMGQATGSAETGAVQQAAIAPGRAQILPPQVQLATIRINRKQSVTQAGDRPAVQLASNSLRQPELCEPWSPVLVQRLKRSF